MTPVRVDLHEPDPKHRRPRMVTFAAPEGELHVHLERERRELWLFAMGPRGGERGHVVLKPADASKALAWIEEPDRTLGGWAAGVATGERGKTTWMRLRDDGRLFVVVSGWSRKWSMALDAEAREKLMIVLRRWAEEVG